MSDTTPTAYPSEAYFPTSAQADEPARDAQAVPAVRASAGAAEAAHLLRESQQLLLESRADEAEPLLRRALELYEREDDARSESVQTDVAAILGALARVYLHNGQFAKAESLLQRLLVIKRARGDDHPEVATVLAGVATVHFAMGAHESAERILRRVLSIREKALAPNHFATTTTIEHLAEACAARGKFEESLALLHQALAMRERTLGTAHPSIAAARTRIADLELLASNEELGAMPMWTPIAPPKSTAVVTVDARQDEPVAIPVAREAAGVNEPAWPTTAVKTDDEWDDDADVASRDRRLLDQLTAKVAAAAEFARTPRGRMTAIVIGVTSLLGALVLAMRARADVTVARADVAVTRAQESPRLGVQTGGALATNVLAQSASLSDRPLTAPMSSSSRSRSATANARRSRASESRETTVANEPESAPLPKAPRVKAFEAQLDRAPNAPVAVPLVASADFTPRSASPTEVDRGAAASRGPGRFVHATLPSDNPTPEYPRHLIRRRIEGRVVAEFLVDATGRIDTRTVRIVSSTDEEFSQAVMDVLPQLRFLPAVRDGVRTEEWVEMPFRFAPKPQ